MKHKLLLSFFMAFIPIVMMAYDCYVDEIYYDLDTSNETAQVTSEPHYEGDVCLTYSGNINIPSSFVYDGITYTVTSIGEYAFADCSNLTSVIIPSSVTSIEDWAFNGCSGLTSIEIPSSVTNIGQSAFEFCSSLISIAIPK